MYGPIRVLFRLTSVPVDACGLRWVPIYFDLSVYEIPVAYFPCGFMSGFKCTQI